MIVVPTVPHTGTHFMRDLLAKYECHICHPYPDQVQQIRLLLETGNPCIIVRRDRWETTKSWIRHGKNPADFGGYSLPVWFDVQAALVETFDPLYLDLDDKGWRDDQLQQINNTLGLELATDWPVIRQPDE